MRARWLIPWTVALVATAEPARAQSSLAGETFHITRAAGPIIIDGDLSDDGWRDATRIEKWYEINPGDNTEPPVRNVGYLTYDDRFVYAAFEFEEPNPSAIRAPLGDHDSIDGNGQDLAGIFLDTLNTGRTATIFLANARNVQYDAVLDDATGENQSPDYFWDSATKIGERGWTLEIRIPFSSLRYKTADPQTWGILLSVDTALASGERLLTQRVSRVRGTYTFTPRTFARIIGQYISTTRNPSLFVSRVDSRSGTFSGSALFAYKINWQSVMFVGYGDERELADARRLLPSERQFFVKLSYAFQR